MYGDSSYCFLVSTYQVMLGIGGKDSMDLSSPQSMYNDLGMASPDLRGHKEPYVYLRVRNKSHVMLQGWG